MAGDWIKMRAELFTYPKFLRLASLIWSDESGAQSLYVTDGNGESQSVTERASHDVTFASLFRVWAAVNAHCKVVGMDAVCDGLAVMDLDPIAGYDGFGDAMLASGLVIEKERNSLLFPNFLEHNEPACLRLPPLTNAQRQAKSRAKKKKLLTSVTESNAESRGVTENNAREEKRREEDPLPPNGVKRDRSKTTEADPLFAQFWEAYPRKVAKPAAIKAWSKVPPSPEILSAVLAALQSQSRSEQWRRDNGAYIPYPATWLNNRRWEDQEAATLSASEATSSREQELAETRRRIEEQDRRAAEVARERAERNGHHDDDF